MNEEISLNDLIKKIILLIHYLKEKWIVIVFVCLLGGLIGYIYAYYQTPKYIASLSFALEDEKSGGGSAISGALGLASSLGLDMGGGAGGAFSGSNLIELMKSRRLVEEALLKPVIIQNKKISLAELYLQFQGFRKKWEVENALNQKLQFLPNADRSSFTLQQDSVMGIIYSSLIGSNLTVEQKDKKISIIYVQVTSENELFSKFFAEILAKEVSDFYIETKSKKAKTNVAILEKQTDSIRSELNNAITGVAIANDHTYNLNPALNVKRTPSAKRQVDVQANTAILTQLVANLEMAKATLLRETPLIQIIDVPILPLQKVRKSKLVTAIEFSFIFCAIAIAFFSIIMYRDLYLKSNN